MKKLFLLTGLVVSLSCSAQHRQIEEKWHPAEWQCYLTDLKCQHDTLPEASTSIMLPKGKQSVTVDTHHFDAGRYRLYVRSLLNPDKWYDPQHSSSFKESVADTAIDWAGEAIFGGILRSIFGR